MEMQSILDIRTDSEKIQLLRGKEPTRENQIVFAICLIGSAENREIREGIAILEGIMRDSSGKEDVRSAVYYLAVGNARLKNYDLALNYINALLSEEPNNGQVLDLKTTIEKKMSKEGLIGAGIMGGAIAAIAGAVIGGIILARK